MTESGALATIRPAATADASSIAALLDQLGYPSRSAEVVERLARMSQHQDAIVLVAELKGETVGLVTGHVFPSIHDSPIVAWLTTLVVSDQHRHAGIGRELARAIETWARDHGATRISLTSRLNRREAHDFYKRIGYDQTGVRLTKPLV